MALGNAPVGERLQPIAVSARDSDVSAEVCVGNEDLKLGEDPVLGIPLTGGGKLCLSGSFSFTASWAPGKPSPQPSTSTPTSGCT